MRTVETQSISSFHITDFEVEAEQIEAAARAVEVEIPTTPSRGYGQGSVTSSLASTLREDDIR
jgi:hypothetical protein